MPKQTFTLTVDSDLSEAEISKLIESRLETDFGSVVTKLHTAPQVVISVADGMASIDAVNGTAEIALIDTDIQDETLTDEDIDSKLEFELHRGDANEVQHALENAREALEAFKDENPSP